jgi:deoxycytidylate deaminase
MPHGFDNICETNDITNIEVLHAETNAITKIAKSNQSSNDAILYVTISPCVECAKLIIQSGIKSVYFQKRYRILDGVDLLKKSKINVFEKDKKSNDFCEYIMGSYDKNMEYLKRIKEKEKLTNVSNDLIESLNTEQYTNAQNNLDEIGADIRNKLSPFKNLLRLVEKYHTEDDELIKSYLWNSIKKELKQSEISIEYLSNLL